MNRTILCTFGALALSACAVQEPEPLKQAPAATPTEQPAGSPAALAPIQAELTPLAEESFAPLSTQEEAAAKAAATISKENADAELAKLKEELAGG